MKRNLLILSMLAMAATAGAAPRTITTAGQQLEMIGKADAAMRQALTDQGVMSTDAEGEQWVDVLIGTDGTSQAATQLQAMGIDTHRQVTGDLTARVPLSKISQVAKVQGATTMRVARQLMPMLDQARAAGNVDAVLAGQGGLKSAYNGSGVVVGIIDSGFQYNHLAFYDPATNTSRISRIWEQKCDTTESLRPNGYSYGCEYAPGKAELSARQYDVLTSTHGTHVAGIAAGSDTRSPYYGVAPGAEIVLVSTKATDLTVVDAAQYIFDYAKKQGKPCVVNISLGSNIGPHDGTGYADRALDALQGEGRLIVGAAGNSAGTSCHMSKTLSVKDHTMATGVAFKSYGTTQIGQVDIWGTENKKFKARLFIYDKTGKTELASWDDIDATATGANTYTYKWLPSGKTDSATVTISTSTGIDQYNNKPNIYIYAVARKVDKKYHYLGIEITASSGTVHMWNDGSYCTFDNLGFPEYTTTSDDYTVTELGGTGKNIISVGSFVSRNSYTSLNGTAHTYGTTIGALAASSAHGPTIDGRVKPEITAPGSAILSAYSRYYAAFSSTNMAYSTSYNDLLSYYGAMQGTSMASPYVAGVMALWLQADPSLTPERAKELIKLSATNDSVTGNVKSAGSANWGYGKINALEGLKLCIESGITGINADATTCLCSANGGTVNVLLGTDAAKASVTVTDLLGRRVAAAERTSVAAGEPISITGVPQGVMVVTVTTPTMVKSQKVIMK